MTNERLEELKIRVQRAESLANDIEALTPRQWESEFNALPYPLRCELYRLGRDAMLKKLADELEATLAEPKPAPVEVAKSSSVSFVTTPDALDCCEGLVAAGGGS